MRCPRVLAHSHYFFPYYSFEPNIGCEKYPVKMGDMTAAAATANEMLDQIICSAKISETLTFVN